MRVNAVIDPPRRLSQQILRVLQDRISRGRLPRGTWLRETQLARDFDVSRDPVRRALDALVAEGMAERLANRGVRVTGATRSPRKGKPVPADMRTLTEKVTDALLKRILHPQAGGCRTSVVELARSLGVSRTPVQRALDRLTGLGLAECGRRGRVYLGHVDAERVAQVYEVRAELEGMAAERAATRMDPAVVERLAKANRELLAAAGGAERRRMVSQEFLLHQGIAESCGLVYLQKLLRDTFDLVAAFQRAGYGAADMAGRAVREHGLVIAALQKREAKLARRRMARHIRSTCRQIMAQIDGKGSSRV